MRPIDADVFEEYLKNLHDKYTEEIEECKKEGNTSGASYLNTHKELLINIMLRLKQQPTVNEWIPCSERLPEDGNNVLICLTNGVYDIAFVYNDKYDCWVSAADDYAYEKESIVAWMPLPEPFKEV